ncbi:MAG TPA: hypothetical protein VHI97_00115 [Actinomycetota bacterium]|nr:hypothetical protein [Actinomycetota bacterium]
MQPFIVDSSKGAIQIYLDAETATVVPVDERGEARKEIFEVYNSRNDLAQLIASTAELPLEEAEIIAEELLDRLPPILRSRWRPWRRQDRKRWGSLLRFSSK